MKMNVPAFLWFILFLPLFLNAQEIEYRQGNLFDASIAKIIYADSATAIAVGNFGDMYVKSFNLNKQGKGTKLLPYEVEKVAYNRADHVMAGIPYASYDTPLRVITPTGAIVAEFSYQSHAVFSADGSLLFGSDAYQMIRALDWKHNTVADSVQWPGSVGAMHSLPDNRLLITDRRDSSSFLWVWKPHNEAVELFETDHEIQEVIPAQNFVVITERLEKISYYYRVQVTLVAYDGQVLQQWQQDEGAEQLTLSPDAQFLAASDYIGKVKLWKWTQGKFEATEQGLEFVDAGQLAFSKDNKMLVMATSSGISFYSLRDFAMAQTISFDGYIDMSGLAVSADGHHYLLAHTDDDYKGGLSMIRFDGTTSASLTSVSAESEDRIDKAAVVLQSGHQSPVTSLVFADKDRYVFSGDEDGVLIKWDLKSGLHFEPQVLFGQDEVYGSSAGQSALELAYNAALHHIAVTADNNTALFILDTETMEKRYKIPVTNIPRHPVFSKDGTFFAFEEDLSIKIYAVDTSGYTLVHTIPTDASINVLLFDEDSKVLAAATLNREIQLFDVSRGELLATLTGHEDAIIDMDFSPDNTWLYSVDLSSNIRRWDMQHFKGQLFYKSTYSGGVGITVENGALTQHLKIDHIRLNKDGTRLYTTGNTSENTERGQPIHSVLTWDTQTGQPLKNFEIDEPSDIIGTLGISAGSDLLATGGLDHTLRLWNTGSSRLQKTFGNPIPEIEDAIPFYENEIILSTQSTADDFYRLQRWDISGLKIEQSLDGIQFGTQNLILDAGRDLVGAEFASAYRWVSFDKISDSLSFTPQNYYSHTHGSPEGGFLFGYTAQDFEGETSFSSLKRLDIDVFDTQKQRKAYTIHTQGIVVLNYANLIPRFQAKRHLLALQTARDQVTLYDYHTGQKQRVIQSEKPILNAAFSGDGLYLWHQTEITRVDLDDGRQTQVYTFTDPVYDPDHNLAAVALDSTGDRLAWISEVAKDVQIGRIKSFVLQIYDIQKKLLQQAPLASIPKKLFFLDEGQKGVLVYKNYLSFYDVNDGHLMSSMVPVGTDDYFYYTPDFFYSSSRNAYPAVGFQFQNQMVSFDQLDLWYNRPDIVMSRMKMSGQTDIDLVYEAYHKRLNQAGFKADSIPNLTALPSIQLNEQVPLVSHQQKVQFSVEAADTLHELSSIQLYANGVPVFGREGVRITGHHSLQKLEVGLLPGPNKIQVSARNELGFESIRETVQVEYAPDEPVASDLYLISINVSDYLSDNDLQYARKDGQDLTSLYAEQAAGFYNTIHIDTLFDADATLEQIKALKDKLLKTNPADRVIIFISGHGLLDKDYNFYFATYDTDFSNPSERAISYGQIEWLLDGIPARRKLLLIDACHSGEVDKTDIASEKALPLAANVTSTLEGAKGVGSISTGNMGLDNSFTLMQGLFANLNRGSGTVVISAAAGNSYALESDEWRNGVFTYSILDGLKNMHADENNDGNVTVSELRQYVYKKVAEETGGRQKPTTRQENLEFDFRVW